MILLFICTDLTQQIFVSNLLGQECLTSGQEDLSCSRFTSTVEQSAPPIFFPVPPEQPTSTRDGLFNGIADEDLPDESEGDGELESRQLDPTLINLGDWDSNSDDDSNPAGFDPDDTPSIIPMDVQSHHRSRAFSPDRHTPTDLRPALESYTAANENWGPRIWGLLIMILHYRFHVGVQACNLLLAVGKAIFVQFSHVSSADSMPVTLQTTADILRG